MPEEEHSEEKRQAVIVGINEYSDPNIQKISGAVNDAKDMYSTLKNFSNFYIYDGHFLLNENATCHAIRKAVSDLLWRSDYGDIALFYFSGHGFVDGRGNGYLAPYDMLRDEPFVCGINMLELKQLILNTIDKATVLMILDCCYSGIPMEGTKSFTHSTNASFDPFFEFVKEKGGEGKIIISSSEEDEVSREIECRHGIEGAPHYHGAFTCCLIKGLEGGASDENGIIYLDNLRDYAEKEVMSIGRQKPKFFAAENTGISSIKIAIAPMKYSASVTKKIEEAKSVYNNQDLPSLINAVSLISDVLNISPKKKEALELKIKINENLAEQREIVEKWLFMNEVNVRPYTPNIFPDSYKLVDSMRFDNISKLDRRKQQLLLLLYKVSKGEIDNDLFIKYCKIFDRPDNISKSSVDVFRK